MRIVALTSFLPAYLRLEAWAERNEHEIVLVVTPPVGANQRYDAAARPFVLDLPESANVLITGKLRSVAAPAIAALEPDLVVSMAFPRLIPAEILDVPAYGAYNLHPSPLPAGRGPNPIRLVYEGAETIGATLHRTEAGFDTGAIMAQRERPLPADLTGAAIFQAWGEMLSEVLEEGTAKAFARDPGVPQDPALASQAPVFTEAERWLDLTEPAAVIRRKAAALNVTSVTARTPIQGAEVFVREVRIEPSAGLTPGTVIDKHPDGWTVQAADAVVHLVAE
ncbi:methionyl-tRNA formyltransferase [Kribbella deserti]|uniref:Methionyl-tRNA formyltransferase n=1 Tax=Kribbella deserti TaxID=1926257 RepID=A0ABV6QJ42_9ACTN